MNASPAHRTRSSLWTLALIAITYYVGARLGLMLALVEPSVTPLWPPTGIAVAGMMLAGIRVWPAVFLAALVVNVPLGPTPVLAAGIAVGNTLAPLVAVVLLRRLRVDPRIPRLRDALALVSIGGVGAMTVSATTGTEMLLAGGVIEPSGYLSAWSVWWAGDVMGVLAFTPLILAFRRVRSRGLPSTSRLTEAALLLGSAGVVTYLVTSSGMRLLYLVFPFIGYAALRFEQRGAALVASIVVIIATRSAGSGDGPFAGGTLLENMMTLQVFNVGVTGMALVLATTVRERRRAMRSALEAREHLEERVHQRTRELEDANARLRELDEMKNAFMTAVSHEMRTPLTVVRGIAETLKRPEVLEDERLLCLMIERLGVNAERLERLLTDLLDLDRLKRGIIEPQRRVTDLRALAVNVVAQLDPGDHPVIVDPSSAIGSVDPAQVERILENLLINAVRHTPPGAKIWVQVGRTDGGVYLQVDDEGPGIPSDVRDEIFEPFVRGDTPSHAPGTGVGLALVARFAAAHGGRAMVADRDGGGASFRVLLADPAPDLRLRPSIAS